MNDTWHITAGTQDRLSIVAAAVCVVIVIGLRSLWKDWRASWSIEDLVDDFFAEPDPHALADRAAMQAARSAR